MKKFKEPFDEKGKQENKTPETQGGITRRELLKGAAAATMTFLFSRYLLNKDKLAEINSRRKTFNTALIEETLEKPPFLESPAQNFFAEWCKINDSIVPKFISREDWLQKKHDFFSEKDEQGRRILFLPEDLRLQEMIDFIRTVDSDTFEKNPKFQELKADRILELGKTFQKAGLYLREYLRDIEEGWATARIVGDMFYSYGAHLCQNSSKNKEGIILKLTEEDKQKLDEWFLGKAVYKKIMERLGKNPSKRQLEKRRIELLRVYFGTLEKEGYEADGKKPWKISRGPVQRFQNKATEQIIKSIKTPERELIGAIFKRGTEFLKNGMGFDKISDILDDLERKNSKDPKAMSKKDQNNLVFLRKFKKTLDFWKKQNYENLYSALEIAKLRDELAETRKIASAQIIAQKELEIADKIQEAISVFPYKESGYNPSEMLANQYVNCVGASLLSGKLLEEIGIKHLAILVPEHALILLATSDKKLYWRDFLMSPTYYEFNHEINKISAKNGTTVADVVNFANNPQDERLHFVAQTRGTASGKQWRVILAKPEIILQSAILHTLGVVLKNIGKNEEAIEAYKRAVAIVPENADVYKSLGIALENIGKNEEAIKAYKQAIAIASEDPDLYYCFGSALANIGKNEEAVESYEKFIALCEKDEKYKKENEPYVNIAKEFIAVKK